MVYNTIKRAADSGRGGDFPGGCACEAAVLKRRLFLVKRRDMKRILAFIVEYVFILVLLMCTVFVVFAKGRVPHLSAVMLCIGVGYFIYNFICDLLFGGITLGKRLAGIGSFFEGKPGPGTAFLHAALKIMFLAIWPVSLILYSVNHEQMPYDRLLRIRIQAAEPEERKRISRKAWIAGCVSCGLAVCVIAAAVGIFLFRIASRQPVDMNEFARAAVECGYNPAEGQMSLMEGAAGMKAVADDGSEIYYFKADSDKMARQIMAHLEVRMNMEKSGFTKSLTVSLVTYSKYKLESNDLYMESVRVKDTVVYAVGPKASGDRVKLFMEEIGY